MNKRDCIKAVLDGHRPPYVPWHCGFTQEPLGKLIQYLGAEDWNAAIGNHFVKLGHSTGFVTPIGNGKFQDPFGVIWNRRLEKDIGTVENRVLPKPSLAGYQMPDPLDDLYFRDIPNQIERYPDCFRVYCIGFSLFERAWTLRGMDNVLMDFYEHPQFLHELLDAIADYNVARVQRALQHDIDAVYFGDDWGQQSGLIMGPKLWGEFLRPRLQRMYSTVKRAGKYLMIHSCGDIQTLIDELIGLGVDLINPFQPEAMDVARLLDKYRGRVSFHGGLSTQQTLAHGSPRQVREETRRLLELGAKGSYIFAPAHAVEGDTPLDNILAFLEIIYSQPGCSFP